MGQRISFPAQQTQPGRSRLWGARTALLHVPTNGLVELLPLSGPSHKGGSRTMMRSCTISCSGDRLSLFGRRMAQPCALQSTPESANRTSRSRCADTIVSVSPKRHATAAFLWRPDVEGRWPSKALGDRRRPAKTAWLFGGSRARTGEKSVIVLDPSANSRIGRYHHGVRPTNRGVAVRVGGQRGPSSQPGREDLGEKA